MGNRGVAGYHGRYTISEFALVKGELLKKYGESWSANDLDKVCRYVAKHDWPAIRRESYIAAVELPVLRSTRESAVRMLLVYDECQQIFDYYHSGEHFQRDYQALPDYVQNFLEAVR